MKSACSMTEAYLPLNHHHIKDRKRSKKGLPPFNHAFDTDAGFFPWLEGEGQEEAGEGDSKEEEGRNPNKLRLERFGCAMAGTGSWEVPGAIFAGEFSGLTHLVFFSGQ
jgi:hypothetical protein